MVEEGQVLLCETAVPIKRKEAKKILAIPKWANEHPVIQCNKDNFLDIRQLTLYKANHADEGQYSCNVTVGQTSNDTLTMTATRDTYEGEELMWQYSKNWLAANT